MKVTPEEEEQFWKNVDKTPGHGPKGECWIWTGSADKPNGYGLIRITGKIRNAHRVSYAIANGGEIADNPPGTPPQDMNVVRHDCDNGMCVRPSHLQIGDPFSNGRDKFFANRRAPLGERNTHAKLTDDSIREIRRVAVDWDGLCDMMKKYRIGEQSVRMILARKSWRHVTD